MKHDVFISHAHKDKSIADAICEKLESARLKCWIAARDIATDEDWTEATRRAIGSSRVVVLLLSENANAAAHIEREIAHAYYTKRTIVPVRLAETLPRQEFLFYLSNISWFNALNPPAEEQLEALTARIKGLMLRSEAAGNAILPQSARKKTATLSPANSWFGAWQASHYKTLGVLKGVAITTFLCVVVFFLWFAFRQTRKWASLAEHRRSTDRSFSLSPTPSPPAGGEAPGSKQTSTFTPFGSWQAANSSPTPLLQGAQDPALIAPAEPSAKVTSSLQSDATPGERTGGLTSERPHHLPPVTHQVSHERHQQFPGTQVKEARRIADLENQRDSLRSQLKNTEADLLATQKDADLVTIQRDELQTRLNESEERRRIAQKNAEFLAGELDELRDQLKKTETRMLTAEKNERYATAQRDALQTRLQVTEDKVRAARKDADAAKKDADVVTRQRDALQIEVAEVRERVQLAETDANLAASQRDAMEAELKKKEEEKAQGKKVKLNQRGAELAELPDSLPDTQFQEVRQKALPVHEDAEFAQTQPPNPGQNAKPAPLTQTLDSSVQPTGP